jgi:sugar phosphate isomerase/epimerase
MRILLASILLEPWRWRPQRPVSVTVSAWSPLAAAAGFSGWELFENHHRNADAAERGRLEDGMLPVVVLNTYEPFNDAARPELAELAARVRRLGAKAIKFNLGAERAAWPAERACITTFAEQVYPARLWCECHPGTSVEKPEALREFASGWQECPFDVIVHPLLLEPAEIGHWGRLLGSRIVHAHVQLRAADDANRFVALTDRADYVEARLHALAAAGFRGSFSLEFSEATARENETPEQAFVAAVRDRDYLMSRWSARVSQAMPCREFDGKQARRRGEAGIVSGAMASINMMNLTCPNPAAIALASPGNSP